MTASAAAARLETAAGSAASASTAAIMDTTRASALRALTTSLLFPNPHRPPHLPLALALLASAARVGGPTSALKACAPGGKGRLWASIAVGKAGCSAGALPAIAPAVMMWV